MKIGLRRNFIVMILTRTGLHMIVGFHWRECMRTRALIWLLVGSSLITELCKADRTTWKLSLQDIKKQSGVVTVNRCFAAFCLFFVMISHYAINIPMCHPMCCLTPTSKSTKAFKYPIIPTFLCFAKSLRANLEKEYQLVARKACRSHLRN